MKLTFFLSTFSLFLLTSCGQSPPQNPYHVDKRFQTSAPNKLLFNNLRSTQYRQQEDPDNRIHRYFHKKWFGERDQGGLALVIVDNWLFDQVYIEVVELNKPEQPVGLPLSIEPSSAEHALPISLTDHQWLNQLDFCRRWKDLLGQSDSLFYEDETGERLLVFPLPEDQRYFRKILSDFDQLTH